MKRLSDSAAQFGRSCQSPRTGFIHLFMDQPGGDTIPVYENFCFALALIRQKSADGVSEGKDLLERLYAFQAPDTTLWKGNFPVYLHDFPRCWNPLQALRITPLLKMLLRDFSHVLDSAFKEKTKAAINQMLLYAENQRERRPFLPLWERRYQALQGEATPSVDRESAEAYAEELITSDLLGLSTAEFTKLIHPALGIYCGPSSEEPQERFEAKPSLLEWWAGSERYNRPHPLQLELAALPDRNTKEPALWSGEIAGWTVRQKESFAMSYSNENCSKPDQTLFRCTWPGAHLHSLTIPTGNSTTRIEETERGAKLIFDLPEEFDVSRNDLIELSAYVNISSETEIFINGKKATVFGLSDRVEIRTPRLTAILSFDLIEGSGDFCGHISRSNRPLQTACKGEQLYDSFDWKIALRTLRRSSKALLSLQLEVI